MKNTGTLQVTAQGDREVVMTRVFDAPRALVYEAFTRPELLRRWFGPRGFTMDVCEVDFRVGGGFRFVLRTPTGKTMGMSGVYRELVPPERSVHLESFDDFPGEPAVVTAVFTERDGKTTLNVHILAPSREARDGMLATGMEHGAAETYDRLAELLAAEPAAFQSVHTAS
jgi:uncharacterized protein YndB with AHSA1/START domain